MSTSRSVNDGKDHVLDERTSITDSNVYERGQLPRESQPVTEVDEPITNHRSDLGVGSQECHSNLINLGTSPPGDLPQEFNFVSVFNDLSGKRSQVLAPCNEVANDHGHEPTHALAPCNETTQDHNSELDQPATAKELRETETNELGPIVGPPIDYSWIVPVIDIDFSERIVERALQEKKKLDELRLAIERTTKQLHQIPALLRGSIVTLDEDYMRLKAEAHEEFQHQEEALKDEIERLKQALNCMEEALEGDF